MKTNYPINPAYRGIKRFSFLSNGFMLALANLLLKTAFIFTPPDAGVRQRKIKLKSYDGKYVCAYLFEPKNLDGKKTPLIVNCHGGGFILGVFSSQKSYSCFLAKKLNCRVILPDYRLAQKYPFPTPVEDCYSTLCWCDDNAEKVNIRRDKIALYGDSAGGSLAAALSQMARDRKGAWLCFQMLIYPVCDCDMATASMKKFCDTPGWDSGLNRFMWETYLKNGDGGAIEYAAPIKQKSFKDIPPTYIETAEFDCLRDEGRNYAELLKKNGVEVGYRHISDAPHGYDLVYKKEVLREVMEARLAAYEKAFQ